MSSELWILAGFVLAVAILVFWFVLRLTDLRSELDEAKRELRDCRKEYWNMRDSYWAIENRLNDLGYKLGYKYEVVQAHQGWKKDES